MSKGLVDQIPSALASATKGAFELEPTADEMRGHVVGAYGRTSPLVVRIANDSVDVSKTLATILPDSIGAITALALSLRFKSTPHPKVSTLAYIVPRFGGGDAVQEETLDVFVSDRSRCSRRSMRKVSPTME